MSKIIQGNEESIAIFSFCMVHEETGGFDFEQRKKFLDSKPTNFSSRFKPAPTQNKCSLLGLNISIDSSKRRTIIVYQYFAIKYASIGNINAYQSQCNQFCMKYFLFNNWSL